MAENLYLFLRYNAPTDELKLLTQKTNLEHKHFVCDLFTKNKIDRSYVQTVNILDKPFHSYTAYIEFYVTLRANSSASILWKYIAKSWTSPSVWLSPQKSQVISEYEFHPPVAKELELEFFSFGTILDGYKYIRYTDTFTAIHAHPQESPRNPSVDDDDLDSSMESLMASLKVMEARNRAARTGPSVVSFSFHNKMMYLYFNHDNLDLLDALYCIELSWARDIEQRIIVVEDHESGVTRMYFQLHVLPKIYLGEAYTSICGPGMRCYKPSNYITGDEFFKWGRKCIFPNCKKDVLGNCTAMEFAIGQKENKDSIGEFLMFMKCNGVDISYCQMQYLQPTPKSSWTELHNLSDKNFDVYWALKTLYSCGYWVIESLVREKKFTQYLQHVPNRKRLEKALYDTASLIENERYINILKAFEHFLSSEYKVPIIEYSGLEYMKSVVCTPLRLVFHPPIPVMSNRILRGYDHEYFIRVSFRDENMDKIMFGSKAFYTEVVYNRLSQSMKILDRQYSFLACSNSQLRSHGVWFYSTDRRGITGDYIRSHMGDLSRIQNVASYVSRMGQCFSNTQRGTVKIRPEWLKYMDDVERNGYCFSDGTGMISTELRDQVAETLEHRPRSLYQIRFGGCKGTVALNPRLAGKQLVIRKSMKKFESDHRELEINEEAGVSRLKLNHQAIMLLEQLGVPDQVFLTLQEKAVFDLLDMMLYEKKAASMIDNKTIQHIKFKRLAKEGVSLITDPFIRKVILLVLYKTIDSIKSFGQIELPLEYARSLKGTMDTTDNLQYGEVFVQYSTDMETQGKSCKVLTGDVIITKFPAVHKGDMRRFKARDVPGLHHMIDCIVFPSQGPRPHPDEMSGSDLDGDDYFVTWLPELLTSFQTQNQSAMDYTCQKKVLGRLVVFTDTYQYVTDYIQNDNLGKISNALKAFADSEEEGFFSEKCIALARKHSQAVDFPKTEIPVDLERSEVVTKYPDFMAKQGMKWVYNSTRVLGKMYRACRNLTDIIEDSLHNDKGYVKAMDMPQVATTNAMLNLAAETYQNYTNGLNEIMHTYGIATEEEVFSGQVLKLHKRMSEKKDMFSTLEIVRTMVSQFCAHFRKLFFQELGYDEEPRPLVITSAMKSKAVAWYNTVHNQKGHKFPSFVWIIADIIGDMVKNTQPPRQTSIERISISVCKLYNSVTVRQGEPNPSLRAQIQVIVREYPGVVVLWLFLWLWCQYQKMDYDFAREQFHVFLKRKYQIDIRHITSLHPDAYTRFDLVKAIFTLDRMNSATIAGLTVGEILLALFRYLGSQQFVNQNWSFNKEMKADYLHSKAMKAYFHLAVYNDGQYLVSKSKGDIELKDIHLVIPTRVWQAVCGQLEALKADIKEVFPEVANVSIRRNQKGTYKNGTLYALGTFSEVIALEQVLGWWFSNFTRQSRYGDVFRKLKEGVV